MKITRNLITSFVSCGVALAMVSTLAAQTIQGQATVVRIKGAARYSQGGTWSDLHVGDVLKPGAIVQTGLDKGCYVDLVLGDETTSAAAVPALAASPSPYDTYSNNYRAQAEQNQSGDAWIRRPPCDSARPPLDVSTHLGSIPASR